MRATGGRLAGAAFAATGVSIDTRSLEGGDLFVALAGDRDGHEFIAAAAERGASAALVSRETGTGPQVVVADTFKALEALGIAARERAPQARRAAITGSVGKTSVTRAVSAGLALAGPSHASVKSYNNHIGVPLTLARMPRETVRAVFEIGMNHAGEIGPLSRVVRPHVATVTTVGPVHVENFPDGEAGVARAKAEIFEGVEAGGLAVLNADDRWYDLLAAEARAEGLDVLRFGQASGADARLEGFEATETGAIVTASLHGKALRFPIAQTGAHWGPNSLAVLLTLEGLGVPLETGLAALETFQPLEGRGAERRLPIAGGDYVLIDESYNANPISMRAVFRTLGARKAPGRRIAVLTDMLELGPDAPAHHAALAAEIEAARVDQVFAAGPLMRFLWEALPPARRGAYAKTAADLAPAVVAAVRAGDVVMVKGSNGSRAALVAKALVEAAEATFRAGEAR